MRRLSSFSKASGFSLPVGFAFFAVTASIFAQQTQQPQEPTTISREVKDVFERCSKAVVKIEATDQHGNLSGTGFFVDPMGTLYTAYSVGGDGENIRVESQGEKDRAHQV